MSQDSHEYALEVILGKIDEFIAKADKNIDDIREKDRNGEYRVTSNGYTFDYTKDVLYDAVMNNIYDLYFIRGFLSGLVDDYKKSVK